MSDIYDLLVSMGLNKNYLGYEYIAFAVGMLKESEQPVKMKALYLEVAKHFCTTPQCVERDIRTAVRILLKNEHLKCLRESRRVKTGPGNAEVLYFLTFLWEKYTKNQPGGIEKIV